MWLGEEAVFRNGVNMSKYMEWQYYGCLIFEAPRGKYVFTAGSQRSLFEGNCLESGLLL